MNPLPCPQARLLLATVMTEPADSAETRALESHLAGCASCRTQAEAFFRQDRALTELAARGQVTDALVARIRHELQGEPRPRPAAAAAGPARVGWTRNPLRAGWARRSLGLAAAVLVGLGIWYLFGTHRGQPAAHAARVQVVAGEVFLITSKGRTPAQPGDGLFSGNTLQTVGEESLAAILYPDGTRLDVGADSTLTELSGEPEASKRVRLTEGYLSADVAPQPRGRPMVLATPQAEVVVLGTKFNLAGAAAATHLETVEGLVRLKRNSDGQAVEVSAGFDVVVLGDRLPLAPQRVLRYFTPRTALTGYTAAAFSADGRTLATWGGESGVAALWDAARGLLRHILKSNGPDVSAAAFSPDGRTLATGGTAGVQLWDVATGELRATLGEQSGPVTDLALPDAAPLTVLAGLDRTVTRWDLATQEIVGARRSYPARAAAIAPDARTLATTSDGSTVTLWDLATGQRQAILHPAAGHGPRPAHSALAFAPDGRTVAASSAGSVTLWDVASGQVRGSLDASPANIQRMAFSPDGTRLALRDGVKVSLWDVTTGKRRAAFQGLLRPAGPVAFAPDGRTLAVGGGAGPDRSVKLWDVPAELIQPLKPQEKEQ